MSVVAPARPRVPRARPPAHPDHAGDGATRAVAGTGHRVAGVAAEALQVAPDRRDVRRPGRHLRPVEAPRRRRSPTVPVVVGVGMVIAALFALAAMHALLISGQVRLDGMRREVAAEHEEIRRLELQVAELESPGRVLEAARERLDMVQPSEVGYLLPAGVGDGGDAPVRVDAAEAPPEPTLDDPASEDPASEDPVSEDPVSEDPVSEDPASDDPEPGSADDTDVLAQDRPSEGGRDE